MLADILEEFVDKTSFHGLKFLIDKQVHWTEKIFWITCFILSCYGCTLLMLASWEAFRYRPISFVVETTYSDWDTEFPSVVVCETENSEKIEEASDKLWSSDHDYNLEEVLKEIAFYKGVSYYLMQYCATPDADPNCPMGNYTYYASLMRSSCPEVLSNCSWNENFFDCCEYFAPMETELGICYGLNSLQAKHAGGKKLKMNNNKKSGPGTLGLNVHIPANIYIVGEEEVPAITSIASDILIVAGQIFYKRHIALRSIENDKAARDVSPEQRRCKYPDENADGGGAYSHHSYSACTVRCRRDAQLALCNCTNFFMPNASRALHCNMSGLLCLHDNYAQMSVLRAAWGTRAGLFCDCQPSCTETDISIIADERTATQYAHSQVEIVLDLLPTERFRRNVVRGPLDLVVSMGGTAGLFLGASILSVVELPYFFFVRTFRKMFLKRNKIAERNENKKNNIPAANPERSMKIEKPKSNTQIIKLSNMNANYFPTNVRYKQRDWRENSKLYMK